MIVMVTVLCRIWEQGRERTMIPSSPFLVSFFLLVFGAEDFATKEAKTLPSIPDHDEVDDLVLFLRATLASAKGGRLRRRAASPPKIALMFLTNSELSFAALWEQFFRGHERLFNVYIHTDPSTRLLLTPTLSFRGRFIPAKAMQQGSPTLISAARRLLADALIDDPLNTFFALISQHCIPLHSFRFTYQAILSDPGASKPTHAEGVLRHLCRSFIKILAGEPALWDSYVAHGDDMMLPEVSFNQFRIGSQFFILTRRHAMTIVHDRRLWEKFKMHY